MISCSLTIASAMTDAPMTDDAKAEAKKASQAPDEKFAFKLGNKFYDSVAARVQMLQEQQMKDEVIVSTVAQEILHQGINVNEMYYDLGDNERETILHVAAYSGNLLVIKILLAAGDKRIDELNCHKQSAVGMALEKRQYAVTTFLVCEAGASVDTAPKILQYASAQGLDRVVSELIQIWGQDKFRIAANTKFDGELPIEWAEGNNQFPSGESEGLSRVIKILQPYTNDSLRKNPYSNSGC